MKEPKSVKSSCDRSSVSISIPHVNVRSLKKHLSDLEALVQSIEFPPNVIYLTETWLTENDDIDSLLVPGYINYAIKDRITLGGGVMIRFKDQSPC